MANGDISKYIKAKELIATFQIPNFYDKIWKDILEREVEDWDNMDNSILEEHTFLDNMRLTFTNIKIENILVKEANRKATIESQKAINLEKKIKEAIKEAELKQF